MSRLTLQSRQALMTFFAPEHIINTKYHFKNRVYNYELTTSKEGEKIPIIRGKKRPITLNYDHVAITEIMRI